MASRLGRSLRLWVILERLYGSEFNWAIALPQSFRYPDLRDRLFASTHGRADQLSVAQLTAGCWEGGCVCRRSLREWLSRAEQSESQWLQEVALLTGLDRAELELLLEHCPFATVHRSIREDLKRLSQLGWLRSLPGGRFQAVPLSEWPSPPAELRPTSGFTQLSLPQTWELLRALEAIAFVQPNLEVVVQTLWEQLALAEADGGRSPALRRHRVVEPQQRIFIHLDYILSGETQEQVDTYQEQLEQLWRMPSGGVVQFDYWMAKDERQVRVAVFPVCLHYVRRAKYLSAWGEDPMGTVGWHNYRLDRIVSRQLKVLAWGDPAVPKPLKQLWHTGQLPTPDFVQAQLSEAWGFNFYLPRELLILRFPRAFARWYVDNTERHPTFEAIAFAQLPALVAQYISDPQEQKQVLDCLQWRSPPNPPPETFAYYKAWIRMGDVNVMMRLRDWRPNGEAIAPLALRQQLIEEARQELEGYGVMDR